MAVLTAWRDGRGGAAIPPDTIQKDINFKLLIPLSRLQHCWELLVSFKKMYQTFSSFFFSAEKHLSEGGTLRSGHRDLPAVKVVVPTHHFLSWLGRLVV